MLLIILCSVLVVSILSLAAYTQRQVRSDLGLWGQNRFLVHRSLSFLFCAVLVLTSAVRHGFIDTYAYRIMYREVRNNTEYIHDNGWGIEAGWLYILYYLNFFSANPTLMLFLSALIINAAYVSSIRKYSADVAFSLLIYFCINYMDTNNGIRQFVAAAIVLLAFPLLTKKKFVWYALCVCLAAQLHESAYVCLIFMLIAPGKPLNIRVCLALFACLVFLVAPSLVNNVLTDFFSDSDSKYGMYLSKNNGMGMMRAFIQGGIPLALSIVHLVKCRNSGISIPRQDAILLNILFLNSALVFMGLTMQYWARLCFYTSFAPIILMPKLLYSFIGDRKYTLYKGIVVLLYCIYFAYNVYVNIEYGALKDFYFDITY